MKSKILLSNKFSKERIKEMLLFKGEKQNKLFQLARSFRELYFDNKVETRSVIEISNICIQNCNFCNIGAYAREKRYIIPRDVFLKRIASLYKKGRRVFLLQSGEFPSQGFVNYVAGCIKEIKNKFDDVVIILCLGNLSYKQYKILKESGADRYILKFETSNPFLYSKIKPNDNLKRKIQCLEYLLQLGYEVGTGNIIGLPGQTINDLVEDLNFLSNFQLKMASCSVFIPGEASRYSNEPPGDLDITLNYMALMRIIYPELLIPSTSSLEKIKEGGQYLGLMAGANSITIHDGTPEKLKKSFPIYSTFRFTPSWQHVRKTVKRAGLQFSKVPL